MPVIVIGADTAAGSAIIEALAAPGREVRAFVSDPDVAAALKEQGIKVALGDVSDDSHVEAASLHCFSAVLVSEAARDGRERSFAATELDVLRGWARAVSAAAVRRVIWVHEGDPPRVDAPEMATVSPEAEDVGGRVAALDDARVID
jgi:nucleoside-diphosphate-sugar epimerase